MAHHYPILLIIGWFIFPQVVDLQKELKERGLDTKGKKDELIARLQDFLSKKEEDKNIAGTNLI
jgi:hypothetical protein